MDARNALAAASAPSGPGTRCVFWTLPPELRAMIFDLYYGGSDPYVSTNYAYNCIGTLLKLLPRLHVRLCISEWLPHDRLLVSRQYYAEAVCAMYRHATITLKGPHSVEVFLAKAPLAIVRQLRHVVMTSRWVKRATFLKLAVLLLPDLRSLRILDSPASYDTGMHVQSCRPSVPLLPCSVDIGALRMVESHSRLTELVWEVWCRDCLEARQEQSSCRLLRQAGEIVKAVLKVIKSRTQGPKWLSSETVAVLSCGELVRRTKSGDRREYEDTQ